MVKQAPCSSWACGRMDLIWFLAWFGLSHLWLLDSACYKQCTGADDSCPAAGVWERNPFCIEPSSGRGTRRKVSEKGRARGPAETSSLPLPTRGAQQQSICLSPTCWSSHPSQQVLTLCPDQGLLLTNIPSPCTGMLVTSFSTSSLLR